MAEAHRLSPFAIENAKPRIDVTGKARPVLIPDGNGLYLQCSPGANGTTPKSWIYRYQVGKTQHQVGLGSAASVTLKQARAEGTQIRQGPHRCRSGSPRCPRR
jgi:hypothetical protein